MITTINEFRKINENTNVGGHFSITENGALKISIEGIDADVLADMTVYQDGNDDHFLWQFFESELTNGYNLVSDEYKGLTEAPMISDSIIDEETDPAENINVWAFMDYQVVSVKDELLKNGFVIFNKVNNPTNENNSEEYKQKFYNWQNWYDSKIVTAKKNIELEIERIQQVTKHLDNDLIKTHHYTEDILHISKVLSDLNMSYPGQYLENKTNEGKISNSAVMFNGYISNASRALQEAIGEIDNARGIINDNYTVAEIRKMKAYQQYLDLCTNIEKLKSELHSMTFVMK